MKVYRLLFPSGKSYIGVAYDPTARFKQHCSSLYAVGEAIRKYGASTVIMTILFEGEPDDCYEAESALIEELGSLSPGGYNIAPGGRGVRSHSPEMRIRMGKAISAALSTPEQVSRASASAKKQWSNPETLERSRQANIETWSDPALKTRHAETMREVNSRPEVKAAAAERARRQWLDPAFREKMETLARNRMRVDNRFVAGK